MARAARLAPSKASESSYVLMAAKLACPAHEIKPMFGIRSARVSPLDKPLKTRANEA
ncbi:hypothetical protein ABIE58_002655 [Roseovarius sp. MBR-78]